MQLNSPWWPKSRVERFCDKLHINYRLSVSLLFSEPPPINMPHWILYTQTHPIHTASQRNNLSYAETAWQELGVTSAISKRDRILLINLQLYKDSCYLAPKSTNYKVIPKCKPWYIFCTIFLTNCNAVKCVVNDILYKLAETPHVKSSLQLTVW